MLLVATHMLGHLAVSRELRHSYDEVSMRFESEVSANASIRSLFTVPDDEDEDEDASLVITMDDRSVLLDKVAVLLGGMAAEEMLLGGTFTDLAEDLTSATQLINIAFANGLFGWRYLNTDTYYYIEISEQKLDETERLREKLLEEQYTRAKRIVQAHAGSIARLRAAFLKTKTLSRSEVENAFAD